MSKFQATLGDSFYRVMHFSAKRGIEIACRPSVRL